MPAAAPASLTRTTVLAIVLALLPAFGRAHSPAPHSEATVIEGTLDVSITGPALKHWGVSAATTAFVPDRDRSAYAQRIRSADDADALCAALSEVGNFDAAIHSAQSVGDGNLEHRSGDEMQLAFRINVPRLAAEVMGVVYVCSSPILAVIGRGAYPDERFESVADQRFRWMSPPLTLHPGETAHLAGAASIDASNW